MVVSDVSMFVSEVYNGEYLYKSGVSRCIVVVIVVIVIILFLAG